ncbi:MAG TPA: GerAB/ArcD/ProY family transporter [Candidatus Onthocola stercorigallinarum]|nr:GerAB/ArcD/ProY family transporter [Candidatus Onthocola stercorigallinarum]
MKIKKGNLAYFLSRSLFLGGGISTLFLKASKDAYIAIILGSLLGIGIIYLISLVSKKVNKPLNEYLKEKSILNISIRIIFIIYIIFLIFILLIILATFLYSYFLIFTPSIISCLPFVFLATYLNSKSIKNISLIAGVLLVLSLVLVFLKTILLANEFDFSNLLPILTVKPNKLFITAILFAVLSTAPFITTIDEHITFKENIKYYLISMLTIFIVVLTITVVLGEMVNIYSYPEYSVLRKISLFKFIENIENFVSVGWFFDIFISLSVCSLKLKNLINVKSSLVPFIISVIILYIVNIFIANNFYNSMAIYKVFPIILAVFMAILLILFMLKKSKKKDG